MTPTPIPAFYTFPVPPDLQWVLALLTVLAFFLALAATPATLQVIWGSPKITLEFHESTREQSGAWSKVLTGAIFNLPIRNRVLTFLGVRRDSAEDICVFFKVCETGTNRVIIETVSTQLSLAPKVFSERISLPPSPLPATFTVVFTMSNGESRIVGNIPISPGSYYAEFSIAGSVPFFQQQRQFLIGNKPSDSYWLGN